MDEVADFEGTAAVPDMARGVQCDAGEPRVDGQPRVSGRFAWRFALNDDTTTRQHDGRPRGAFGAGTKSTKHTKFTKKSEISSTDWAPLVATRFAASAEWPASRPTVGTVDIAWFSLCALCSS